ncbi:MAG: ATP-dependent sacrificial sulfur transferase LarE [Firmicutes bacterium]|nr:ATP-dependent sacrificial sulfur transferase LarE [Bacillota bacterium]
MEGLERLEELKERMAGYAADGDLCVAFSGGVDSALVLAAAMEAASPLGRKVYAVTFSTKLHGMGDLEAAERVARELGAVHRIIEVDELAQEEIRNNPRNRCYLCKKSLFVELKRFASEVGAAWCLEGTNGDDLHSWRPGLQALKELEIESPLALLGISKEEVRALAKQYGVSVAHRPSSPCMATRLPYGTVLDHELLRRIDAAESRLRTWLGGNVRLRLHGDVARIEVDRERFGQALMLNDDIVLELKKYGFHYVTLDLEGFRSGSMDE